MQLSGPRKCGEFSVLSALRNLVQCLVRHGPENISSSASGVVGVWRLCGRIMRLLLPVRMNIELFCGKICTEG